MLIWLSGCGEILFFNRIVMKLIIINKDVVFKNFYLFGSDFYLKRNTYEKIRNSGE